MNGALAIRSERLLGRYTGKFLFVEFTTPMTYSRAERASQQAEKQFSTKDLVDQWKQYNYWRSGILLAGTMVGAYALTLDA